MVDNTRVNEFQEKILQAMNILNAHSLESLSYDKTIICTIKEDSEKEKGKYTITDGTRTFTAYSNDIKLRVDDVVYVTIPQGNFENQKIIVGKKTDETTQPFVFTTPFDTIFDMTDNICYNQVFNGQLIANTLNKYGGSNYEFVTIYDKECNFCGYTRLGVKADFKSWIKNAVRGTYGLAIVLTVTEPDIASSQQVIMQDYYYTFSNKQMYGNTYDFETNYEQQLVIPLDEIQGTITHIKINFYQEANFFDKYGKPLPCSEQGYKIKENSNEFEKDEDGNYILNPEDVILAPNIFVQNLYLCFGYDISIFTNDLVQIYTQQSNTYKHSNESKNNSLIQNQKEIKMRWVHVEDGIPIDMVALAEKETIEIPYEIRWYKYQIGAVASDIYCGAYWVRIENANDFQYLFNPDINKHQEKIKAIIIYNSVTPYRSNELLFENEEDLPPSAEAQHIINALNIMVDDGTNGNYMIYGQNNDIKDTQYGKISRSLSVRFDANNDGKLEPNETIQEDQKDYLTWRFPAENTMIKLLDTDYEEIIETESDGFQKVLFYEVHTHSPWYEIGSYYSPNKTNNTITCSYNLNNRTYISEKEFTFGKAGTMGSDQTLVIDFSGDTKSVNKAEEADDNILIKLQLYDNQNIEQDIPDGKVTWAWYYNSELLNEEPVIIENWNNSSICFSKEDFDINHLYILQATLGNLTTYFSIPIQDGRCSFIEGPTEVIYQSDGEASYSRDPYTLYENNLMNDIKTKWRILHHIPADDPDINKKLKFIGTIDEVSNKLRPLSIYVKDAPIYGVQALDENDIPLWTQPILVLQNQWPNGVINAWDGKSLVLDEENNTIITASFAAGKKNSDDNTFSGVMIGDWKGKDTEDSISQQTGIYGFDRGAMSYAFKEDGTAFLGKDGKGRINFDGNEATIYSATYDNETSKKHGIKIDLDDPYIVISNTYNDKIADSDTEDFPFQIGSNFKVEWDGTIYATNGNFTGIISASTLKAAENTESTKETITLEGTLTVLDKERAITGGYLGYIEADYGGFIESSSEEGESITTEEVTYPGIGIRYKNQDSELASVVKATSSNAGMSCGKYYLSLQNINGPDKKEKAVLRSTDQGKGRLILDNEHIGIGYGYKNSDELGSFISLQKPLNGSNEIVISTEKLIVKVDAENQEGIYARFA